MTNLSEFLECLTKNIHNFEKMIKALREMKEASEKEHDEKLRLKTASTVTSTIGTAGVAASVVLAPFTGGASLFAAAFIGTTFTVAGGVGNIVADYTDGKFQNEQVEKLNEHLKELEAIGKELDEKLSVFNSYLKHLDDECFDQDNALRTVISSLASNALALVKSPMLLLMGSVVNRSHCLTLTNSKQTLPDLAACSGIVVKDLLRDKVVLDLDKFNNTLSKENDLEQILNINTTLTAVTGALNYIQVLNTLETAAEASLGVGLKVGAMGVKPMATAGGEILKSVQLSAQEAASLGLKTGASAGGQATKTAAKTTAGTAGKILSYATVGFSVALTIYEIGCLVNEYGKGNVLEEEITKMIDFCTAKLRYLQELKTKCLQEHDDDDEECKCKSIRLKVLYFNGRSINSESKKQKQKMAKIRELLYIHYPNIVAISETWLDYDKEENELVALLQLAGYMIFRQDRNDDNPFSKFSCLNLSSDKSRRGGGLLVAFRTVEFKVDFNRFLHLDYKDNMMTFEGKYDYLCNKCPRPLGKSYFRFGFALGYRPPNLSSKEDKNLKEAMQDNCAKLCNYDGWAFVADFNCGNKDLSSIGLDIYRHTDFPVTHTSGNGLDQVVYEQADFVTDARVLNTKVSDHHAILFNMNLGKDYTGSPCPAKTCYPN